MSKSGSRLFENVNGSIAPWISASSGISGIGFVFGIGNSYCRVELYIDRGKNSELENDKIFDLIYQKKQEIENNLGNSVLWERKEKVRYRSLRIDFEGNIYDINKWDHMISKMTDQMNNLEKVISPHLNELKKLVDNF